ncbi:MAG: DUF4159 domain-containing protein [Ignavibacteriales bacterium]|nr:DUF4159 domain-containing protein [Ignavibacteriales bacterium]MBI3787593.1 DUF4159 domain-containing protein [Ignavibacteriales bacterium]
MTNISEQGSRRFGRWRKQYQRYFGIAFLIAAFFHLIITSVYHVVTERKPTEVTTSVERKEYDLVQPPVKFELRAPRLAKSFSVTKVPSYSQSFTPREIKFEQAQVTRVTQTTAATTTRSSSDRANKVEGSIFYGAMTGGAGAEASWGIPGGAVAFGRSLGTGGRLGWGEGQTAGVDFSPDLNAEVINVRTGGTGIQSMRNELISAENLADRFEGFVEVNPANKKKVRGFINFYQLQWRSTKPEPNGEEGWNAFPKALYSLQRYAQDSTEVRVTLAGNIRLDDRRLWDVPVLFMMGYTAAVQYTQQEAKNLGKWLRQGGFLFVDDGYAAMYAAFNKSTRALLKEALGYDAEFERIQNNHWLYHCWEDFGGPPSGLDDANLPLEQDGRTPKRIPERYPYLEGIFLNGRLAVLFSSKGYTFAWGQWPFVPPSQGGPLDNARQLHFGVNIMVYASTAKGSIIDQNKARVASEYQRK